MQLERKHTRPCGSHERVWRGRCVDKNLLDGWLDALNSLSCYSMISICEGHSERMRTPNGGRPHINLRLKEHLLPLCITKYDQVSVVLQHKLIELFGNETTSAYIEIKIRINSSRARQEVMRDVVLHVDSRVQRTGQDIDPNTENWFSKNIVCMHNLDEFSKKLWE